MRALAQRLRDRTLDRRAAQRERRDTEHLRLLLAFALAEDANCIDVGAHTGAILRELLHYAPRGRHIAYEPLPEFHARLEAEFPGVDVRRAALSDTTGEASFTYVPTLPSHSGFRERSYPGAQQVETIAVRMETLDASLPDGYVPALVKIDVEGAELQVLRGGIRTISEHKPIVVFEHGRGAADHYRTRPEDVHDLLSEEAGLRVFDLDGNGPLDRSAFAESFERGQVWNYVAHAGLHRRGG